MKAVKITIEGDLVIVDYCSHKKYEEENNDDNEVFLENYYMTGAWDKITALYIDDNEEENLVKRKGKYVKTKDFFHNLFRADGEHPLPVDVHYRYYTDVTLDYIIELENNEEFDIKKVQLVKSDYECQLFPYFILCDHILYDGREVENYDYVDYCPEEKMYNEDKIEELYD